jgi:hypothetical protein
MPGVKIPAAHPGAAPALAALGRMLPRLANAAA